MTVATKANAPKKSPAALAAAHVAVCARKANETQALLSAAQNTAVAAVPHIRSAEETRAALASAAARDAITGGREALALAEKFEHERRAAAEQEQVAMEAASTLKAVADQHAQAEADLAAATAALDAVVTAEASKLEADALRAYGQALKHLVAAFDSYMVAGTLARGVGAWRDMPVPAGIPTLGTPVNATVAAVEPTHVHWHYQHLLATVGSAAQQLRQRIIDGGVE
jgi:hypothetical protein